MSHKIFDQILKSRDLTDQAAREIFMSPDYESLADPLLLPDMKKALERLEVALERSQKVVVYGDYDIDGLSATTLLLDALESFGFNVGSFIPSRFDDGYGLSQDAIGRLADNGAELLITVDCGSLSFEEVRYAKERGVDVIITDHHNIEKKLPEAVAVINPKRKDHAYPFRDFAGVGVAFGLVRAMQTQFKGLEKGQEKWLLDLVALGTICDIVPLIGENRILARWGLKVLHQTRRPGLKALMQSARIEAEKLSAKSLGFSIGPRLNASGRLETAELSLNLLVADNIIQAQSLAEQLEMMNTARRTEQQEIFEAAKQQAKLYADDPVLVLHHPDWNHGIIGIVAAKLVELYHKPAFVLQEIENETKGSARSFGDFSVGEAIKIAKQHIVKGGGHTLAAGVTLETHKISDFRRAVNEYYHSLELIDQELHLLPKEDIRLKELQYLDEELVNLIAQLEPFGHGNPQPVFKLEDLQVLEVRNMGDMKQHIKLRLQDESKKSMDFLAFSAPKHFFVRSGDRVSVWVTLNINEWRGNRNIEGYLLELEAHT